jgi:hypothetical protein
MRPGELEKLYPSGERNYVRLAATDHLAPIALIEATKELGNKRVFVTWDRDDPYIAGFRRRHAPGGAQARALNSPAPPPGIHALGTSPGSPERSPPRDRRPC